MEMFLPKEWYIANIQWLEQELNKLPRCTICKHNGRNVLRIYNDKTTKEYTERAEGTPTFIKMSKYAHQRKLIQNMISENKNILRQQYKINYNAVKDDYYISPNNTGFLDINYWQQSLQHSRKIDGNQAYSSDGVEFKSRLEMNVATEIKNLGLTAFYDPRVFINSYNERFADYLFFFPMFNRCAFMELFGSMEDYNYKKRTKTKLDEYIDNGFYIGRDLFILSGDANFIPGQNQIRATLIAIITTMCELYVKKKSHQNDDSSLYQFGILPAATSRSSNN